MKMQKPFISVVVAALLIQFVAATNHTVGAPNGGWDDMTDLQTWVSSQKFVVGDYLVFVYQASHNVLEVSKGDYDSCNADNPKTASAGGFTVIELKTPGKIFFICGATGHCARGMKIEVDVLTSAAPPPATPSVPPPTPASTPSTPPSEATPAPPTEAPSAPTPHAEPVSGPVSSPSQSPKHSPVYAPKVSPAPAPSKSHGKGLSKAPARSPSKAPVKSTAPSEAPSTSPSGVFAPAPRAGDSAATKATAIAGSAVGLAFAVMTMLLTL